MQDPDFALFELLHISEKELEEDIDRALADYDSLPAEPLAGDRQGESRGMCMNLLG